jgi:hypothetical protein
MIKADKQSKAADLMTQITYSFKKLEFKDSRKRVEKSLKNRKKLQCLKTYKEELQIRV